MRTTEPGKRLTWPVHRYQGGHLVSLLDHVDERPHRGRYTGAVVIEPRRVARRRPLVPAGAERGLPAEPGRGRCLSNRGERRHRSHSAGRPRGVQRRCERGYDTATLSARVGERVRFWVLDAGPNRPASFHIVGAQFDTVYREGGYELSGAATLRRPRRRCALWARSPRRAASSRPSSTRRALPVHPRDGRRRTRRPRLRASFAPNPRRTDETELPMLGCQRRRLRLRPPRGRQTSYSTCAVPHRRPSHASSGAPDAHRCRSHEITAPRTAVVGPSQSRRSRPNTEHLDEPSGRRGQDHALSRSPDPTEIRTTRYPSKGVQPRRPRPTDDVERPECRLTNRPIAAICRRQ